MGGRNNSLFGGNTGFGNIFNSLLGGNSAAGNNMNFPQAGSGCPITNIFNGGNFNAGNCAPNNTGATGNNTVNNTVNSNNCIGNSCLTNCSTCTDCSVCPECPQCGENEPAKNVFELEKGYLYSLRIEMSGARNLVVTSSDTNIATASLRSYRNGTAVIFVSARNAGSAVITVCPANNPAACETVDLKVTDTTAAPYAPAPATATYAEEVLRHVNEARAKNGLSALQLDATLSAAAEVRAKEVNIRFSHTRPNGTSCFTVLREFGIAYNICGENIALGFNDARAVVNGWMNSSSHRANILNPNYKYLGVGKSGTGWCQLFTG
jgi:uncharacterized protein YkwD